MANPGPKPKRKMVEWSDDLAYAVGLMASDGNLSRDGRHLTFVSKDKEQIDNIKKCLGITASERRSTSNLGGPKNYYYRLQWGDVTLYDFLLDIGITPNKSLTLGPINVPNSYFFCLLRGLHDGDGSFYSYFDPRWKNSFMFYLVFSSASRAHVVWLQETLNILCGVRGHVTTTGRQGTLWNIKYAKRETAIILNKMYPSASVTCLSRKRLKIEEALRIVGLSLNGLGD